MLTIFHNGKRLIFSIFLALSFCLLVIAMLIWPKETYESASYGLNLWATVLVPSMLPFFIMAELLLSFGIVKILGGLLEPVMRPVFNLPGSASFVLAMGFTSGFPMGAILTRRLYEEGLCSTNEGERLVAFTNNSSPLFILAAIGIGMFQDQALGLLLAISHYLSNLLLGIILGLFSKRPSKYIPQKQSIFKTSISDFLSEQKKRNPIGTILGNAIKTGINNILMIGGFVIFFAVLTKILSISGLQGYISGFFMHVLNSCGFDTPIYNSLAIGFWEMTLGLKELSLQSLSFQTKVVAGSIILGWSGLSIQAQVISFISGSSLRPQLYHCCRIIQAFLSALIAFLLSYKAEILTKFTVLPVFSILKLTDQTTLGIHERLISIIVFSFKELLFVFSALLILAFLIFLWHLKDRYWH